MTSICIFSEASPPDTDGAIIICVPHLESRSNIRQTLIMDWFRKVGYVFSHLSWVLEYEFIIRTLLYAYRKHYKLPYFLSERGRRGGACEWRWVKLYLVSYQICHSQYVHEWPLEPNCKSMSIFCAELALYSIMVIIGFLCRECEYVNYERVRFCWTNARSLFCPVVYSSSTNSIQSDCSPFETHAKWILRSKSGIPIPGRYRNVQWTEYESLCANTFVEHLIKLHRALDWVRAPMRLFMCVYTLNL